MARILADARIPHVVDALSGLGEVTLYDFDPLEGHRAELSRAEALVVRTVTKVDATLLSHAPAVRVVATASAGFDHLDLDALHARDIAWHTAAGCNAVAVADHVATWASWLVGADPTLLARPFGVVGFGQTGRRAARHLRHLGFDVLVCDPPLARLRAAGDVPSVDDPELDAWARAVQLLPLDELIHRCGAITLHVPLVRGGTDPTEHMIDADRLRAATQAPIVCNAARGGVVDDASLLAQGLPCLLDVFDGEPRILAGLLRAGGPVRRCSPHIAGYTLEAKLRAARMVAQGVASTLGERAAWHEQDALPPAPPPSRVVLPPSTTTATAALGPILASLHELEDIEGELRTLAGPDQAGADAFSALRKGYPLRREFTVRTVDVDAPGLDDAAWEALVSTLAGLGIQRHSPS